MKVTIDNQSEDEVKLRIKLEQICEFFADRGVLGVSKDVKHLVFEYGWAIENKTLQFKKFKLDHGINSSNWIVAKLYQKVALRRLYL